MTLKEILDSVLLESGIGTETVYAGADTDAVKRLVNLANRSVTYLNRYRHWQALRKTYVFSMTTDDEYPLPSDFLALIPDTGYAQGSVEQIDFDTDSGLWAYLKAGAGSSEELYHMRILGNTIKVFNPQSGEQVRFEYVCNTPVRAADGTLKQRFTADTDEPLLDDELVLQETLWRYQRLLGLPTWQDARAECQSYRRSLEGQESGSKSFIGGGAEYVYITGVN